MTYTPQDSVTCKPLSPDMHRLEGIHCMYVCMHFIPSYCIDKCVNVLSRLKEKYVACIIACKEKYVF